MATLNNNSVHQSPSSSPENSDDFVFVSNNIPLDPLCGNNEKYQPVRTPSANQFNTSPDRPKTLPISEPKPVPSIAARMHSQNQANVNNFETKSPI